MLTLPGRAGESVRLIPFDLPRTLPELAFFQPGGPRHEECVPAPSTGARSEGRAVREHRTERRAIA